MTSWPSWNRIMLGSCHDDVDTLIRFSTDRSDHLFTSILPNCNVLDEYLLRNIPVPMQVTPSIPKTALKAPAQIYIISSYLSERSASMGSCSTQESLQSA